MGIMDKIKSVFGKAKASAGDVVDKAKEVAHDIKERLDRDDDDDDDDGDAEVESEGEAADGG